MHLLCRARNLAASTVVIALMGASAVSAQDITDAHLKAARGAVDAIGATTQFDQILPAAAFSLKDQLIQKNPDLQEQIEKTVDDKTIAIASRRSDLEKEAALAYAKVFTEAELTAIGSFYASEAGKKLLSDGPIVTREVNKAADIWQRGVARDLAEQVGTELAKISNAASVVAPVDPSAPQPTPVEPAAPAPAPN